MKLTTIAALSALMAVRALAAAPASETTLSAGAAEVDITPSPLITDSNRKKPYGVVLDPLAARAVVLGQGQSRVALIVIELIGATDPLVAQVRQEVEKATGIPGRDVLINATHTHSAPRPTIGGRSGPGNAVDPLHRDWAAALPGRCVEAVRLADAARRPVTLHLGRANAAEWVFNRRPIMTDGTVKTTYEPPDPHTLPNGMRFGRVDPTLTVLQLRDTQGKAVTTLFHLPCHSVSVYPSAEGISADWSAPVVRNLRESFGAPAMFLQGCAGDIVPARRGLEAVAQMGKFLSERAHGAIKSSVALPPGPLRHTSAEIGLPLTPLAREESGTNAAFVRAEIHVVTIGTLAIVTLPGEPLSGLGFAIQERSPYPHTLVLGYSNGSGAGYVGMPGDKAKGGYEMTRVGRATDEAGGLMIETAVRLLHEQAAPPPPATAKKG